MGVQFIFIVCAISFLLGLCNAQHVTPTDGMVVTKSMIFAPGNYSLPNGISIGANHVSLDMNGATLIGTNFTNRGIFIANYHHVKIWNGNIHNYYYGIVVQNATHLSIDNCNLSRNWVDPSSLGPSPPWLNIFVPPENYNDSENFGGGIYFANVTDSSVTNSMAMYGENGIDCFYCDSVLIRNNTFSNNTGWGVHLFQSHNNSVEMNEMDFCNRANLGDSAGILLACSSTHNWIVGNRARYGGDGIYLAWSPIQEKPICCQNSFNHIFANDFSFASANCLESDFSLGCVIEGNILSNGSFGAWLGYSHAGNIVLNNKIAGNSVAGIAIDHGQDFIIDGNLFEENANNGSYPAPWYPAAILLWSDEEEHYDPSQFVCLAGYDHLPSRNYTIRNNKFISNFGQDIVFVNTTNSLIYNNAHLSSESAFENGQDTANSWNLPNVTPGKNIINGPNLGGSFYSAYKGCDKNGDGIGDTELPFNNNGNMLVGDFMPLTNTKC